MSSWGLRRAAWQDPSISRFWPSTVLSAKSNLYLKTHQKQVNMFREKNHLKDKDQNVNSENFPVSGVNACYFYFHNLKRKLF